MMMKKRKAEYKNKTFWRKKFKKSLLTMQTQSRTVSPHFFVYLQHFDAKTAERQSEINEAIRENLENPHVKRVFHLAESNKLSQNWTQFHESLSNNLKQKLEILFVNKWMFYSDAMIHARQSLSNDKNRNSVVCIINSDCYLSKATNWNDLHQLMLKPELHNAVICQSRVEKPTMKMDPKFERLAGGNTQDAWFILLDTLSQFTVSDIKENFSYALGRLGCDNLIAHQFFKLGLKLFNFGSRFHVVHNDVVRQGARNYLQNDLTRVGSRLVPDYDSVTKNRIDFLTKLGIPYDEGVKIAVKVAFYAISLKLMNQEDKLTLSQILVKLNENDLYKLTSQILNAYVKISN
jgi:hypothetical protein